MELSVNVQKRDCNNFLNQQKIQLSVGKGLGGSIPNVIKDKEKEGILEAQAVQYGGQEPEIGVDRVVI